MIDGPILEEPRWIAACYDNDLYILLMKILFLTSHAPEGEDHGARLRVRHLVTQLSKIGEVTLVLAGAYEDFSSNSDSKVSEVIHFHEWRISGLKNRMMHELGYGYLNTNQCRASDADRERLLKMIHDHDVTWVHGFRIPNAFDLWKWPKTILDIDDIPSRRTYSEMLQTKGALQRLRALRHVWLWKRHESRIFDRFEAMTVCSELDRKSFPKPERVFVVPNGFDPPAVEIERTICNPARIGFIGSLEYPANSKGLRWFLREVWPAIQANHPGTSLRLVGRDSRNPEWLSFPNVEGLGWVADSDAEMATWALTIVPVFEGGGTRVKISNAFSRKCPVVSSRLGAYGYEVEDGRELRLADSAADFSTACIGLLNEPGLGHRLAATAWEAFLKNWTWDSNEPRLRRAIRCVLGRTFGAAEIGEGTQAQDAARS